MCAATATARACDHQDGSAPHVSSATCVCGKLGRICDSSTGVMCDGTSSVCSHAPACSDLTGAKKNSGACNCGSIDCTQAVGFYCFAAISQCSVDGTDFVGFSSLESLKSSGKCDDDSANGWGWIRSQKMCKEATVGLGLRFESATISSSGYPPGCINFNFGSKTM